MNLILKHLLIALILIIFSFAFELLLTMEWPGGIDSFFLGIGYYLLFYLVPIFILTLLFETIIMKRFNLKGVRYMFGLLIGCLLIGYHFFFILNGNVEFEKHQYVIYNALLISPLAVFLCEHLFFAQKSKAIK